MKIDASPELFEKITDLFSGHSLAVLATSTEGHPYCSLVAFAAQDNLKRLCFATTRATRKFANLERDSRVSMLIDNRSNVETDIHEAMAVTLTGTAAPLEGADQEKMRELYLARHPYLEDFVNSPTCALIGVTPARYIVVRHFQEVMVLEMG